MADKTFTNVRIKNKIDTTANWNSSSLTLKKGELAVRYDNNDYGDLCVAKSDNVTPFSILNTVRFPNHEKTILIANTKAAEVFNEKIEPVQEQIAYNADNGVRNLLGVASSGTATNSGITSVRDVSAGTITISGTSTAQTSQTYFVNGPKLLNRLESGKQYVLRGCSGGSLSTYYMEINYRADGSSTYTRVQQYNNDVEFTFPNNIVEISASIRVVKNATVNNVVIKPTLCRKDMDNGGFPLFAPSNRELFEMILALQT